MKSGFTAIIGRPNVGKSTLLNQILEQKIVIATNKAQTTRKRIKGIYTTDEMQIVFVDTPGIHKPLNKLGEFLLDEAKVAVPDADVVLFLVDVSTPAGKGDKWIVDNVLSALNVPVVMVLNKTDKASPKTLDILRLLIQLEFQLRLGRINKNWLILLKNIYLKAKCCILKML